MFAQLGAMANALGTIGDVPTWIHLKEPRFT